MPAHSHLFEQFEQLAQRIRNLLSRPARSSQIRTERWYFLTNPFLLLLLAFILCLSLFSLGKWNSQQMVLSNYSESEQQVLEPSILPPSGWTQITLTPTRKVLLSSPVTTYPLPPFRATSVYVMDAETNSPLLAVNADAQLPIASTTKIMTAIVALEHGHLDDQVTISAEAAAIGESTMGLRAGEQISLRDLLYGLLLPSGNDAAIAIAEHIAGSQVQFAALMNSKASALGLHHSHFVTPHGLDAPEHYSSAHDLAVMAAYGLKNPMFAQIVSTKHYLVPATNHNQEHILSNYNYLLNWYPGVDGVKPGFTYGAGICQVVSSRRNGRHLIAVVLHTPDLSVDIRNALNYGFRDFDWVPSGFASDYAGRSLSLPQGGLYYVFTGHSVSGPFLDYMRSHGGLEVIGYPRTEPFDENGENVQYFVRQELVLDKSSGTVTARDLGKQMMESLSGLPAPKERADALQQRYLATPTTSRGAEFQRYFFTHGGVNSFGQPLSGALKTRLGYLQFFEYGALVSATVSGDSQQGLVEPLNLGDLVLRKRGWIV